VLQSNFNLTKVKRVKNKKDVNKIKKKHKKIRRKLKTLKPLVSSNMAGSNFGLDLSSIGSVNLDDDLLQSNEDVVMDENSVDSKPRILDRQPVEFPEKAINDNVLKGMVEIRMLINSEGRVENTQILSALPKGYFEEVALAMVQNWKFEPASYRGQKVSIWAKQVVRFGN